MILERDQEHYTNTIKFGRNLALLLNFIKLLMAKQSVVGRATLLGLVSSYESTVIKEYIKTHVIIQKITELVKEIHKIYDFKTWLHPDNEQQF